MTDSGQDYPEPPAVGSRPRDGQPRDDEPRDDEPRDDEPRDGEPLEGGADSPETSLGGGGFGVLERLFAEALERDPATWPQWLQGIEPLEVRGELQLLLDSHLAASQGAASVDRPEATQPVASPSQRGLFGDTSVWLRDALKDLSLRAPAPIRVGSHRIEREIGRGGMGVVYRGVTEGEGYERPVAVKVLQGAVFGGAWLATPEMRGRFAAERGILARLRHPNIAALIDGGTTDEGTPWLAMELVEGEDILAHVRAAGLGLRKRLRLFQKVCGAVAHAHANLVVHRDLKPSNVLVDRSGMPKLLDFGIAKLVAGSRQDAEGSLVAAVEGDGSDPDVQPRQLGGVGAGEWCGTLTGDFMFTPDYSSPEQVSGGEVTTRTDVHALGLLLYELLTGERAQRVGGKDPAALRAAVCERMPAPPSSLGRKELRGDLDAIALRALARDPEDRYGSAQELSDDLDRWLRGMPVRARRATLGYHAGKFVGRHRLSLGAAALVAAGVIASAVLFYRQSEQLAEQAHALELQAASLVEERNAAERESRVARGIAALMVGMFELPDVASGRARSLTAVDLVDIARRRVVDGVGQDEDPLLRASLLDALGRAYLSLALPSRAEPLLTEAFTLRRQAPDVAVVDLVRSRWALGWLRLEQGRLDEADRLLSDAAAGLALLGPLDPEGRGASLPIRIALTRATLAETRGDVDALRTHLERARDVAPKQGPDGDRARASWLVARVGLAFLENDLEQGLVWAEEALALREGSFGPQHPEVAQVLRLRGDVLRGLGRYEAALEDFRRAIAIQQAGLGADHPVVDDARFGFAKLLAELEQLDEAETLLRDLLARDRQRLGNHPTTGLGLGLLGNVLGAQGRFDEAERAHREAVDILRAHGADAPDEFANALSNFGVLYLNSGRFQQAGPLLREALELRRGLLDEGHPDLLTSYSLLAMFCFNSGELGEAEQLYVRVHQGRVAALGEHPDTAGAIYSLGAVAKAKGDFEVALVRYEQSASMYRRVLPEGHPDTTRPLFGKGALLVKMGRLEEARPALEEALQIRRAAYGELHHDVAGVRRYLARCFSGDAALLGVAKEHYVAALEVMAAYRGPDGSLPQWGPFTMLDQEAAELFGRVGEPDLLQQILGGR